MAGAITIRAVKAADWELFRRLRLEALEDAPLAFGSTYEREADKTEDDWRDWLGRADGERLVAYVDGDPAGLAAVYLRQEERDDPAPVPELISMWVHPDHRGSGAAEALVDEVVDWVRLHGFDEVRLMVAAENDVAQRFYERIGFTRTGYTQPLPHDESRDEHEMARPVEATP